MTRKRLPFHEEPLEVQVHLLRKLARDLLLGREQGGAANADLELVPAHVLRVAGLEPYENSTFTKEVWQAFSTLHAASFALGVAVGQLAPWIGADKGGAR